MQSKIGSRVKSGGKLFMSRLFRIFTVCLVNLFFHSSNENMMQTRSLSEFT